MDNLRTPPWLRDHLERAVQRCVDGDVLLIAAAGNDGCQCLHVPASLDGVIAVGSHGERAPSEFSNHHIAYLENGITAPGENITGAALSGGTQEQSGTSVATPIVSAAAALLLSLGACSRTLDEPAHRWARTYRRR